MGLDANSAVWAFHNWGRPFRLVSPSLDCLSLETTPIQVECDTAFSAVLTGSGDVYVWWPSEVTFMDKYSKAMDKLDRDESTMAIVPNGGTVIPCHTWKMDIDPVKLPTLPNLPNLPATGLPEEECRKETKLIKIAVFWSYLIGLTNKGHVLKMNGLDKGENIRTWNYVSENV